MVNYSVPLFAAAWVPLPPAAADTESENGKVVLAGGACKTWPGQENSIFLCSVDFQSKTLSEKPVARLITDVELFPYGIAVHPRGGLICLFPNICKWVETDGQKLTMDSPDKQLPQLKDLGELTVMTFNKEGTFLAVGNEDGKLIVFEWPGMRKTLDENFLTSVKDLDFSRDGKFLVSVESGLARIWNVATSACVASLPRQEDEIFCHARFSRSTDQVLYITTNRDKGGGSILKWNTSSWDRISKTDVTRDKISVFNVSPDGKLISVGTNQGDILVVRCAKMRVKSVVREEEEHCLTVCALAFSFDSRALLSASLDSSTRLILVKKKKKITELLHWVKKVSRIGMGRACVGQRN